MRSKYKSLKELSLILIIFQWLINLALYSVLSDKVLPLVILKLEFLFRIVASMQFELLRELNSHFYLVLGLGMVWLIMTVRLAMAVVRLGFSVTKNYLHVTSLNVTNCKDYCIIESEEISVFTAGIFNPSIYVSRGLIDRVHTDELAAIIQHEQFHKDNYDPFLSLLINFFINSTFIFPFKKQVLEGFITLTELSADIYAQNMIQSKQPLIKALSSLIQDKLDYEPGYANFFKLPNRIEVLIGKTDFSAKKFIALIMSSILIIGSLTYFVLVNNLVFACQIAYYS